MINRHIKNLILYKLVVVEGRLLREQHERKIHFVYAKNHHFFEKNDDFCFVPASNRLKE